MVRANKVKQIAEDLAQNLYTPEEFDPTSWLDNEKGLYHPTAIRNFTKRLTELYDQYLDAGDSCLEVEYGKCGSEKCHFGKKGFALIGNKTRNYTPLMIEPRHEVYEVFHCSDMQLDSKVGAKEERRLKLEPCDGLLYYPSEEREKEQEEYIEAIEAVHSWGLDPVPAEDYEKWFESYRKLYKPQEIDLFTFLIDPRKKEFHDAASSVYYALHGRNNLDFYKDLNEKCKGFKPELNVEILGIWLFVKELKLSRALENFSIYSSKEPTLELGDIYKAKIFLEDCDHFIEVYRTMINLGYQIREQLEIKVSGKVDDENYKNLLELLEDQESILLSEAKAYKRTLVEKLSWT